MTEPTDKPELEDVTRLFAFLTQDAPDQQYAAIGWDPHMGDYQAAGPFPTREDAKAYGDEVAGQINDEQSKRDGLPDVIYTVGLHFTPPRHEEQPDALYSTAEVDAAADALREYLDYDDAILAVAAEKALAAAATARPFSPRA